MSILLLHSVVILAVVSCALAALPVLPGLLHIPGLTNAKLRGAIADYKLRGALKKLSLGTETAAKTEEPQNRVTNNTSNYRAHEYEPSKYKDDEYMGWVHWMQHVPTADKVKGLTQGFFRRLAHSFFNHETHTLKGLSPELDSVHNMINSMGKLIIPSPKVLDHFDTDVPPVLHPNSHLVEKWRTRTEKATSALQQRLSQLQSKRNDNN